VYHTRARPPRGAGPRGGPPRPAIPPAGLVDPRAPPSIKPGERDGETHTVTADSAGRFKATLASGSWTVYTHRTDGQLVANTRIDVREDKTSEVKLTSR
jgi:hypothetical protein